MGDISRLKEGKYSPYLVPDVQKLPGGAGGYLPKEYAEFTLPGIHQTYSVLGDEMNRSMAERGLQDSGSMGAGLMHMGRAKASDISGALMDARRGARDESLRFLGIGMGVPGGAANLGPGASGSANTASLEMQKYLKQQQGMGDFWGNVGSQVSGVIEGWNA